MWLPGEGGQETFQAEGAGVWRTCRKSRKEASALGAEGARGLGEEVRESPGGPIIGSIVDIAYTLDFTLNLFI